MENIKPLMDALEKHRTHYKKSGDYSVTELIAPPRMVALSNRHRDELIPARASMISSFYGTAVHKYFEHCLQNKDGYLLEKRIAIEHRDKVITGTYDILVDNKHLYDVKTCKTWKTVFDPHLEEWHQQQNLYAYMLSQHGIYIESINILALYQDWIESKKLRDNNYPADQVILYPLNLWDEDRVREFLDDRLLLHIDAEDMSDDDLPECTMEERWEDPQQFALFKTANSNRAARVLDSIDELIEWCRANPKKWNSGSIVEVRHQVRKRCEKYCDAKDFCNYYKWYMAKQKTEGLSERHSINDYIY